MSEQTRNLASRAQPRAPIFVALAAGAILGAIILGGGGRLAMRGITLWEDRARQFTIPGSFTVVGWGAAFGAAAAGLRVALDAAFERWLPNRTTEAVRGASFAVICLALGVIVLTPLTMHRLVLFPPLIALYVLSLEMFWRHNSSLGSPDNLNS